jgi:hypothetical protein
MCIVHWIDDWCAKILQTNAKKQVLLIVFKIIFAAGINRYIWETKNNPA